MAIFTSVSIFAYRKCDREKKPKGLKYHILVEAFKNWFLVFPLTEFEIGFCRLKKVNQGEKIYLGQEKVVYS